MAQTGYTPIQLYRTTTSGAAPVSGNLNPGELAININDADMALYAKNNTGTVKRLINNPAGLKYPTTDGTANYILKTDGAGNLSWTAPGGTGTVTSVSGTGTVNGITLTGTVTSSGNLTLGGTLSGVSLTSQVSGTLPVANGGTGVTSSTGSGSVVLSTSPTLTTPALGTPTSGTLTNCTGLPIVAGTTGTLSVARGGTGVTTSTGTGNVVLSTSPTLTTPALGTPSSGTLSSCTVDGTDAVGFRNIPINSQSAAYTAVLADSGKCILHPSTDANARTFTIPANGSVAYPIGTAISFVNMTSQVVSIAITTDTMYLAGTGTTGTRSLAQYGTATALKLTSTTWIISGAGLT